MVAKALKRPKMPGEFQMMNDHIYGDRNRALYSDSDLVRRLLEQSQLLAKVARKDYRHLFGLYLADTFSWYNALANRLGLDTQEIMWQRFPGVCSYCLESSNCLCGIDHPQEPNNKAMRLRALRLDRDGREPHTLTEHQEFHAHLYSWQHKLQLPLAAATHIGEEAAEVSEALRHNAMDKVAEEMADALSWTFAFATRVDLILADVMWEFYPYACRKCKEEHCTCKEAV
jgi:NTP pyrophosphatase (non-canonical NTP hydrolase)